MGADGTHYLSPRPGTIGGHRRTKVLGLLDCRAALRAVARGGNVDQRVFFAVPCDAANAGHRPCAVCVPGAYQAWKSPRPG